MYELITTRSIGQLNEPSPSGLWHDEQIIDCATTVFPKFRLNLRSRDSVDPEPRPGPNLAASRYLSNRGRRTYLRNRSFTISTNCFSSRAMLPATGKMGRMPLL